MTREDITAWINTEFAPLTLATPAATIAQQVENAIVYWNTHSAHRIAVMATLNAYRVQMPTSVKGVYDVMPAQETAWILRDHPLWTLVGIQVLDNVTSDLIIMSEAYRNYRQYTGTNFTWHWERSDDPAVGGYLYVINMPAATTRMCVICTKRILPGEDITSEHIYNWVRRYAKALVRCIEGNTLRKAGLIQAPNDGADMIREGLDEIKELKAELSVEGRWAVMAKRR